MMPYNKFLPTLVEYVASENVDHFHFCEFTGLIAIHAFNRISLAAVSEPGAAYPKIVNR